MWDGSSGQHDGNGSRDDHDKSIENVNHSSHERSSSRDNGTGTDAKPPRKRSGSFWETSSASGETRKQSSFAFMGGEGDGTQPPIPPSSSNNANSAAGASAVVSTEHERQILLLMLLAQVCALHDPTPRTFTVHVLELFERGILDRESIRFLFDYGLVPSLTPSPTSPAPPRHAGNKNDNNNADSAVTSTKTNAAHGAETSETQHAVVPYRRAVSDSIGESALRRSQEASAIRSHLEHHHSIASFPERPKSPISLERSKSVPTSPTTSSWAAKHFPLSLSRYQREFNQIKLLASGSFGQVFSAIRHMDGRKYAVKKVIFSATGYSNDSVTQVVREVHCLAQCDHEHCVRYYTSWLEPSWMTGQGSAAAATVQQQEQQLLTDMERVLVNHDENVVVASTTSPRQIKRRFSFDNCFSENDIFTITSDDDSDYSEWTCDMSSYNQQRRGDFSDWAPRDDSNIGRRSKGNHHKAGKNRPSPGQQAQQPTYKYQICLYIQMELCCSTTLADWIQNRNATNPSLPDRAGPALQIFRQVCSGIAHIHSKSILHRDLKPANIFASFESGEAHFKIGDFGLSKMLRTANGEQDFVWDTNINTMKATNTSPTNNAAADSAATRSLALVTRRTAALPTPPLFGTQDQDLQLLTAGVGTASYAAPEQVESRTYGPEADIFSMGLVLLELFCCFGTQHERFNTFQECRKGKLPLWIHESYPDVASTILACCDKCPISRPTAQQLLASDMFAQDRSSSDMTQDVVQGLKGQLREKDAVLQNQRLVIAEKDRVIEDLRRQMDQLKKKTAGEKAIVDTIPMAPLGVVEPATTSSYSDDEDY